AATEQQRRLTPYRPARVGVVVDHYGRNPAANMPPQRPGNDIGQFDGPHTRPGLDLTEERTPALQHLQLPPHVHHPADESTSSTSKPRISPKRRPQPATRYTVADKLSGSNSAS